VKKREGKEIHKKQKSLNNTTKNKKQTHTLTTTPPLSAMCNRRMEPPTTTKKTPFSSTLLTIHLFYLHVCVWVCVQSAQTVALSTPPSTII
jgi:hypothetical protein